MTNPNLQLTPEEKSALEKDALVMGLVKEVNTAQQSSFASLFPDAIPMSTLQYWSGMRRPDAIAHLKQAIAAGDDVNEHSGDGYTALHGATENGCVENVKLLLACGADITIRTTSGKTALDFAREQGHDKIVGLLEPASLSNPDKPWWKFW